MTNIRQAPISVIFPTAFRPQNAKRTIEKIASCRPGPFEIIVHIDAGDCDTHELLKQQFKDVKLIFSQEQLGPSGGRNVLIEAAQSDWILSLDDDSWPMDQNFLQIAMEHIESKRCQMLACQIIESDKMDDDEQAPRNEIALASSCKSFLTSTFGSGACLIHKPSFQKVGGFKPLKISYGMEENDLAFKFANAGFDISYCNDLKIFHDCQRSVHRAKPEINAAYISNLALLAYLNYPITKLPFNIAQIANRVLFAIRNKRYRGILRGMAEIPVKIWRFRSQRKPVSESEFRRFRKLSQHRAPSLDTKKRRWYAIQLGARENFSIPSALKSRGLLKQLITDLWLKENQSSNYLFWGRAKKKLAGRTCAALADSDVVHFNGSSVCFEVQNRFSNDLGGWRKIIRRNHWFQKKVCDYLTPIICSHDVVFSYSYTAKQPFKLAKSLGAKTILGQIDPGPTEEDIVANEVSNLNGIETGFQRAPEEYWKDWRDECELADVIVVNSDWSRVALVKAGIPESKIQIIPLVYEPNQNLPADFRRTYPREFSKQRPLQVLYLGQVIPRKGIHYLVEAAKKLEDEPVVFTVVGDPGPWKNRLRAQNINSVGQVARNEIHRYYQQADLFLFPTLSDGFGLTQLEAQFWQLPILCSENCGRVVRDGIDGVIMKNVTGQSIKDEITRFAQNPSLLELLSQKISSSRFSTNDLEDKLIQIAAQPN